MAVPCGGSGVSTTCLFLIPSCPSHPRPGHGRRTSWRWGPWNATRWRGPTRAVGSCPRSPSTMSWRPTFRPTTTALPGTASAREQPSSSWKSEVTAALAMSPGHRAAWGLRFLFSPGAWLRDTALFWAHHSLVLCSAGKPTHFLKHSLSICYVPDPTLGAAGTDVNEHSPCHPGTFSLVEDLEVGRK